MNSEHMIEEAMTILYIDDDPDDLLIFGESICTLYPEITVLKAQSAEEGIGILNQLEQENKPFPCLIMLDMNMPKKDGRQTLKDIRNRQQWEEIPVVIFTTSSNSADIEFCRSYGSDCITKPMSYKNLQQTIKQILSHSNIPHTKLQ
jgi:CheY-like chemotaxis protein